MYEQVLERSFIYLFKDRQYVAVLSRGRKNAYDGEIEYFVVVTEKGQREESYIQEETQSSLTKACLILVKSPSLLEGKIRKTCNVYGSLPVLPCFP